MFRETHIVDTRAIDASNKNCIPCICSPLYIYVLNDIFYSSHNSTKALQKTKWNSFTSLVCRSLPGQAGIITTFGFCSSETKMQQQKLCKNFYFSRISSKYPSHIQHNLQIKKVLHTHNIIVYFLIYSSVLLQCHSKLFFLLVLCCFNPTIGYYHDQELYYDGISHCDFNISVFVMTFFLIE